MVYLPPGTAGLTVWADDLAARGVGVLALGHCATSSGDSAIALRRFVIGAADRFEPVFGGGDPGKIAFYRLRRS